MSLLASQASQVTDHSVPHTAGFNLFVSVLRVALNRTDKNLLLNGAYILIFIVLCGRFSPYFILNESNSQSY